MKPFPFLTLLLALALFGCSGPSAEGVALVRNDGEYNSVLADISKTTTKGLTRYISGAPLDGDDLKALEEAVPKLRGLIAHRPQAFGPHVLLGQCLRATGDLAGAADSFRQGIAQAPDNGGKEISLIVANCHSELSAIALQERDFLVAEKEIREAILLIPDSSVYYVNLARIQVERRQLTAARESLDQALKLDPKSGDAKVIDQMLRQAGQSPTGAASSVPKDGGTP